MAITVIIVGIVNCFLLGLMRLGREGAGAMQLGSSKEAVGGEGVLGGTESEWEEGAGNGVRD